MEKGSPRHFGVLCVGVSSSCPWPFVQRHVCLGCCQSELYKRGSRKVLNSVSLTSSEMYKIVCV